MKESEEKARTQYNNLLRFLLLWGKNEYTSVLYDEKKYQQEMENPDICEEYKKEITLAKKEFDNLSKSLEKYIWGQKTHHSVEIAKKRINAEITLFDECNFDECNKG